MIRIYPYIFSLLACIGIALPGYSQVDRNETLIRSALHGLEYEIKAGFSIGGTAPLPLPVEIRSIDGYNPTLAISIEFTDDKIATYDFSDDLRHFQWGLQVGAGWRAFKHLNVYADLTWGLNDIFKSDFNTITFAMYPIYLNIGFGYAF